MQLLLAISPSHSEWSKEKKKEIHIFGKAQHTFSEESTVLNQGHRSLLSNQDPRSSSESQAQSKILWPWTLARLAQCKENSCPLEDGWWHQLLWSRARTNGQLTSTCPLHNNQQENQIEISSHSSHESRTGFGPLGIKEKIAIQAISCIIVLTVL